MRRFSVTFTMMDPETHAWHYATTKWVDAEDEKDAMAKCKGHPESLGRFTEAQINSMSMRVFEEPAR